MWVSVSIIDPYVPGTEASSCSGGRRSRWSISVSVAQRWCSNIERRTSSGAVIPPTLQAAGLRGRGGLPRGRVPRDEHQLELLHDLVPDQLVTRDQRVPEPDDDVAVLLEQLGDPLLLLGEDLLDPGLAFAVGKHLAHEVLGSDGTFGDRVERHERARH